MLRTVVLLAVIYFINGESDMNFNFDYLNMKDDAYDQPVDLMSAMKTAHDKEQPNIGDTKSPPSKYNSWAPYDFSKFESYMSHHSDEAEHNRIKRRAKRRRGGRRRGRQTTAAPASSSKNETGDVPVARKPDDVPVPRSGKKTRNRSAKPNYDTYDPPAKDYEAGFVEMPKDLYQAHLRPGVIFRIHMSEAVLKMQYRNYGEDKDESVIEADVEYLRLTRKVINDEITKFEDLRWLVGWFNNRSDLIIEHTCNTRYFAVGIPPTMFTHAEEYMKRMCLFDNVYLDHIPYVIGEDGSLIAAVAPPVLYCDAATCTSVPFVDSVMFDEKLTRTNVRTLTRCQASCRAHCKNDPDCLKRCSDRCLRAE